MTHSEQQAVAYLQSLGYTVTPPRTVTFEQVVQKWLAYKRERHQTYKPRGLEAMRRRLFDLSGGDPNTALAIVEQSMANNYAGIFPLKSNNQNAQQSLVGKISAILGE